MARRIDFDAIKREALAAYPGLLEEWLPDGHVEGHEFKARNPTRGDKSAGSFSININTGKWGDFSSGETGGDAIDLYAYLNNIDMGEAARRIGARFGLIDDAPHGDADTRRQPRSDTQQEQARDTGDKKAEWRAIIPVPDDAPRNLPKHPKYGKPSMIWTYRDAGGGIIGFICRFDTGPGEKEVLPLTYCECKSAGHNGLDRDRKGRGQYWEAGQRAWRFLGFPAPRPLYGLDRLANKPDAVVIMTEGEKAADAAQRMYPDNVVIAWPGGSKAMNKIEWSPLNGRRVIFWPDNDKPGYECAAGWIKDGRLRDGLMQILNGICALLVISPPGAEAEKGWDAADAESDGWTQERAREWMTERVAHAKQRGPLPPLNEDAPPAGDEGDAPAPGDEPPLPSDNDGRYDGAPDYMSDDDGAPQPDPFRVLGYNRGTYYYLPTQSGQVVELSAGGHTKLNLLQIAPLWYWESRYPKKGSVEWDMAANALINMCHAAGVFRPHERRRGRGAWLDQDRRVLHLGDVLLVDGKHTQPVDFDSIYTYEGDSPLGIRPTHAASTKDAHRLIEICRNVKWENGLSADALAGWCVIAPVCGVLNWRPHVWVTGPAGSGKTTVIRDIVGRVVGPMAIQLEGKTTEAAIRHSLGFDALPVIFDEAESEDQKSVDRIQNILDLARAASSESGGSIRKATNSGGVRIYRVRSCFCFSSINTALKHYADETRVTTLVLSKIKARDEEQRVMNEAHYEDMMALIDGTLTPEFAAAMILRSVDNLATLRENADTFTKAAAVVLGNRRIGDQIGPMLAGAYLCHSTHRIKYDDAVKWLRERDWSEHTASDSAGDEGKLLQHLIETRVRVNAGNGSNYERTLGELISVVLDDGDESVPRDIADAELKRCGIRAEAPDLIKGAGGGVFISTTSNAIRRFLSNTPWAANWRRPLLSMEGAQRCQSNIRFTPALSTPAVLLPVSLFRA